MNYIFRICIALTGMISLPMTSQAASIQGYGRSQLVAIESSLRQLPSVRVFLADYFVPPFLGRSFRMQWTADGQPMSPNLDRVHAECIFNGTEALSCEALKNWFGDVPPYGGRKPVKSQDRQAFFIPNMEFDTEYCFRFQADDEPWSAWTCAHTPPKPALPIAPSRPTLTAIPESTETRARNAAHPFSIYVEWDAVPHEDSLTEWYAVEMRNPDGLFFGNSNWSQRPDAVRSYHQILELPGNDPDGEYVVRVCAVNVSGRSCSLAAKTSGRAWAETAKSHQALADAVFSAPGLVKRVDNSGAVAALKALPICDVARDARARNSPAAPGLERQCEASSPKPAPLALGRVRSTAAAGPSRTMCEMAQDAAARNSPTAPALAARCRAGDLQSLPGAATRGEILARQEPLALALRNQQSAGAVQHGFDIGMAVSEGQTADGPDKQRIRALLSAAEQGGFDAALNFSLERNRNADLASRGAAVSLADPAVAQAHNAEANVIYWLGFDIATGLFGDPASGGMGITAVGPAEMVIRSALSAPAQRGFNAAVALLLGRN